MTEVDVCYTGVWRCIAGDVKQVEGIYPEIKLILKPNIESLGDCHIDSLEAGARKRARVNVAKVTSRLCGEDAGMAQRIYHSI